MGAKWTVHQQRPALNVGVPEMQRAALCVGRRGAPDPSPWNAGPRIRNWSLTAPRALAPLRVYLNSSTEEAAETGICEPSSVSWYGKR